MKREKHDEVAVGAFVTIGFILLTIGVFFISGVYLFRSGYSLHVMYEYVSILDKGAPVRMAGVRVGEVSQVTLVHDPQHGKTRVEVKLFIEKGVKIGENYTFAIRGTHILSEPHIEISPQPGTAPLLKSGAVVEGMNPIPLEALIERANNIASSLDRVMTNLSSAVEDKETSQSIKEIVNNLASLTHSLNLMLSGREEDMKATFVNMRSSTEALSKVLEHMEQGQGTVGKLLMEDELYVEMRDLVREIKTHPWRLLKKDKGRGKFLGIF